LEGLRIAEPAPSRARSDPRHYGAWRMKISILDDYSDTVRFCGALGCACFTFQG
jgi:hypothetical protein